MTDIVGAIMFQRSFVNTLKGIMLIARTSWAIAFAVCVFATFTPALFGAGSAEPNNIALIISWSGAIGMLAFAFAAMVSFLYSFTRP